MRTSAPTTPQALPRTAQFEQFILYYSPAVLAASHRGTGAAKIHGMHRRHLLDKLAAYRPGDATDERTRALIRAFINQHQNCFESTLPVGHLTGAAWLVNRAGTHVLLTHHRQLDKWLQLGGHADGNPDILAVALREAREESGLENIVPVTTEIFDLDVHPIPARGDVPRHDHYDIRFLCRTTGNESYRVSDESHDLAWVARADVAKLNPDPSVLRMHRKWMQSGFR